MKLLQRITFCLSIFLLCFNGACDNEGSVTNKYKPEVNFYGSVTDIDDKQYMVEDITLSGQFKDIHVFPKPHDPRKFSTDNYEKLNLAEVKEIRPIQAHTLEHKGIKYIEIQVTRTDGGTDLYMIPKSSYVEANRKPRSGPIVKVLTMDQLKSVVINDYTSEKEDEEKNEEPVEKES